MSVRYISYFNHKLLPGVVFASAGKNLWTVLKESIKIKGERNKKEVRPNYKKLTYPLAAHY